MGAQCREREGMRRGIAELETARRTQARHGGIVQRVRRVGKKPLHLIGRGALRLSWPLATRSASAGCIIDLELRHGADEKNLWAGE